MVAMAKVFLLLLVVFKATALENSSETDSNHELFLHSSPPPSPLTHPPHPSPPPAPYATQEPYTIPPSAEDHRHEIARALCIDQCRISCLKKKFFAKVICLAICAAKCTVSPTDSLDDITCTVDCTQSSAHSLRYDAGMMEERVSSCYQQCKRG